MILPFTTPEFVDVFRRYNEAMWPVQPVLLMLGIVAVVLAVHGGRRAGAAAGLVLALLWAWMGIVYHIGFFRRINPMAGAFGALFLVQAALFAWAALRDDPLAFDIRPDLRGLLGLALVAIALLAYPLVGMALGHRYPAAPTFGLPCPTTILTLGLLVWTDARVSRWLFVVPLLWAALGATAAVLLDMREDLALVAAGLAGAWALVGHRGHRRDAATMSPSPR